jgi:hypothetical protein
MSKLTFRFNPNSGGSGRFGSLGNSILSGTKLKRGRLIFNSKFRCDKSIKRLGIFTLGIGIIGNSGHKKLSLHVY